MGDEASQVVYRYGRFTIEPARRRLRRENKVVDVESKAFDLIVLLLEQRDQVVGKQDAIDALWGRRPVTDAALNRVVHKARAALEDDGDRQGVIRTVYGRGLRWIAPVRIGAGAVPPAAGRRPPRHRLRWAGVALSVLLAAAALAWWLLPRPTVTPGSAGARVAIVPLTNATGQKGLDWTEHGLPGLLASMLADDHRLHVLDTAGVSHAWGFAVPKGQSHLAHLRQVTGAGTVIVLRLTKLAGALYELDAHVDGGRNYAGFDVSAQGPKPAHLAVELLSRIRRGLGLDPVAPTPLAQKFASTYLAATYARGMDAAVRDDWTGAKPYFALIARDQPGFLPARLQLGRAQMRTDAQDAAQHTLQALAADAKRTHQPAQAALAWLQLSMLANAGRHAARALALQQRARIAAADDASPDVRAAIELQSAKSALELHRKKAAAASIERARRLIDRHHLHDRRGALYLMLAIQAHTDGDVQAANAALRKSLELDTANGDDGNVLIDDYNLAYAMTTQGRAIAAVPLYARAWQLARAAGQTPVRFMAALNLSTDLLDLGAVDSAAPFLADARRLAQAPGHRMWRRLVTAVYAYRDWYRGDYPAALRTMRDVMAAFEEHPPNDNIMVQLMAVQANAALQIAPDSLAALAARMQGIARKHESTHAFDYQLALLQAQAAAAANDAARVIASLRAARAAPHPDDATLDSFRVVALSIAARNHDAAAAHEALTDFDIAHCPNADVLRWVAIWAKTTGEKKLARQADGRRRSLARGARQALASTGIKPPPLREAHGDAKAAKGSTRR